MYPEEFRHYVQKKSALFESVLGHSHSQKINNVTAFGHAIIDTISRYSQLVFYKVGSYHNRYLYTTRIYYV